jgi:hypothetical protein
VGLGHDGDGSGGDTQEGAAGDGRRAVSGHQEILQIWQRGEITSLLLSGAGKVVDGALGIETTRARPDESDGTTLLRIRSWFQGKAEAYACA